MHSTFLRIKPIKIYHERHSIQSIGLHSWAYILIVWQIISARTYEKIL